MNNINDQPDATIIILLIFESAQHVSANLFPIFRSVRLVYRNVVYCHDVVVGLEVRRAAVWTMCSVLGMLRVRATSLKHKSDLKFIIREGFVHRHMEITILFGYH
jgi:hypothetical protein